MNISPANISIPVMSSSVNPATEQTERDNRAREQIIATKEINEIDAKTAPSLEEKRQRKAVWEPAEHLTYSEELKQRAKQQNQQDRTKDENSAEKEDDSQLNDFAESSAELDISPSENNVIAKRYHDSVDTIVSIDVDLNV